MGLGAELGVRVVPKQEGHHLAGPVQLGFLIYPMVLGVVIHPTPRSWASMAAL